jgi:hypothetical protein
MNLVAAKAEGGVLDKDNAVHAHHRMHQKYIMATGVIPFTS